MGGVSRANDLKAEAIADAVRVALEGLGLNVKVRRAGDDVGILWGEGEGGMGDNPRTATRLHLPHVVEPSGYGCILPGWRTENDEDSRDAHSYIGRKR